MAKSIVLTRNIGLPDRATADRTSTITEPSVAANRERIFVTGNWFASRSLDDGASWDLVDPYTAVPSAAGGFCCDQLTLYDPERDLWIWLLQYSQDRSGTNVFRIATASTRDFERGRWRWWDIAPSTLSGDWTNVWFDYPDAALTGNSLYVTFNVFRSRSWQRAVVMRFPLRELASGAGLGFG